MPDKRAHDAAIKDKREGKSASTQAGEYVHEAIENIKKGKHGARSAKQAIAIGLSQARRDGVHAPVASTAKKSVKKKAAKDSKDGEHPHKPSRSRSAAATKALEKEGSGAVTSASLSAQSTRASATRTPAARSAAAKKAAETKGAAGRSAAAKKAARNRRKSV